MLPSLLTTAKLASFDGPGFSSQLLEPELPVGGVDADPGEAAPDEP